MTSPISVSVRIDRLHRKSTELNGGVENKATEDGSRCSKLSEDDSRARYRVDSGPTGSALIGCHVTGNGRPRRRMDYDTDIIDGFLIASFDTIDELQLYADGRDTSPPSSDSAAVVVKDQTSISTQNNKPDVELRCFEYDDEDDGEKTEEDDPSVSRVDSGFEDVPDVDLDGKNDAHSKRSASQEPYNINDPIVTNKFASPRPLVGVPQPTSGIAVAASLQRGGGGSTCESVSPTSAQVPLNQSSEPRLLPTNGIANLDPLPGCCHPASSIPVLPTSSAADSFSGSRSQNEDVSRRRVGASSPMSSVSGRPLRRRRDSGNAESAASGTKRRYTVMEKMEGEDEDIDDDGCRFSRDVSTDENFNVATQRPVCTTTVSPSRERKYADDVVVTSLWDASIVIESLASSSTVFGAKGPDVPRTLSPLPKSPPSVDVSDEKSSSLLAATAAVTTAQMGDSEIVLSVGVFESSSLSSNGCGEAPEMAKRSDVVGGDGCVRRKIDSQAPILTGSQANRPVCGKVKVDCSYPLPIVHCGTTSQPEVINGHGGSLVSTAAVFSSTLQNSSLSVSDIQSNHHPVFQTAVSTPTSNFVSPFLSRHSSVIRQRPLATSSVSASVNSTNQHSSTAAHQASTPSTQLHRWPPFHTPHLPSSSSSSTASHLLPGQRPTFRFPSPVSTSCSVPFSSPFSHRDDAIRSLFSGATGYGMFLPPSLHGFPPPPAPPLLQQLQSIAAGGHFAQSQPQSAEALLPPSVTRSAGTSAKAHSSTMLNLASPANAMTHLSDVTVDGRMQRHLASNHSELMTRLQQELNTRFLQDRGLLPPPSGTSAAGALLSPFTLHTEMHQHLHHHQHHMMPSSGLYLPLPNVPPTANDQKAPPDGASLLAVAERELAAKVSGLFPSLGATQLAPKLPTVFGPAGNNGVNGAFQPKAGPLSQTMTPASQLLLALRDRDHTALNTQYPPATIRKPGKWCSAHVRTAWNIQFRKQRNAVERHGTANGQSAVDMRRPIPPSSNGMAAPLNLSGLTSEAANGANGSWNLTTPSNIGRPLNVWNGTSREESPQQRFGKCNNSRPDKESGMAPDRKQLRAAELTDKVKAEHGDKAKERLSTGRPPGMPGMNEVIDRRSHSRYRSRSRSPRSDAPRSSSTGGGISSKNHRSSASRDHPKTHSDADPDILHVSAPTRSQHTPSIDLAIASLLGGGPSAIFPPFPLFPPPDLCRPQFTPTSSGLIPTSAGDSFSAAAAGHRSNGALSADSLLGPLAAFAAAAADARLTTTDSLRLAATTNAHLFPSAHNPMSLLFPSMLPLGPPYQPSASVGLSQLSSSPISRFTDLKSPTLIGRAGSPASALSSRVHKQRQSFNGGPVDCLTNSTGETRSNGFSSAATNRNAKLPPPLL